MRMKSSMFQNAYRKSKILIIDSNDLHIYKGRYDTTSNDRILRELCFRSEIREMDVVVYVEGTHFVYENPLTFHLVKSRFESASIMELILGICEKYQHLCLLSDYLNERLVPPQWEFKHYFGNLLEHSLFLYKAKEHVKVKFSDYSAHLDFMNYEE